ncbi:hypothetical protein SAMN06265365_13148 [Tistlia consotensis]|uniref:MAPEG family protein n=1 Tax=Tistlia consotensis USBA 355 TaxID=560819 RepID=A0A1Y6CL62_9PROT|nr:MAPEG family protein [Tistlia consotensis]SMF74836.1 hypothetical protein SAMN05428998_13348 [Tistlia consotensis USBA 355]SNS11174.1 hypothetical protein SAMN06265365_13148 [Tistlia consotensis]
MTAPTIVPVYAALLGLLLLALSINVIRLRRRLRVSLGDGGDARLARPVRAQGNFVDYVPMVLLLLLLAELGGGPAWLLHLLAGSLLLGRLLHAWCFLFTETAPALRIAAMALTFVALAGGSSELLLLALR